MILAAAMPLYAATLAAGAEPASLVRPMMGTGAAGCVVPVAAAPFGMVQLGPDTYFTSSGYHYDHDVIYGFSHTHKSGGGGTDFQDIMFFPVADSAWQRLEVYPDRVGSRFSHEREHVESGYYRVRLLDSDIDEMDDKKRNSTWLRAILRSYARNISTEASQATIAADMGGEPPSENTVADYLDALRRTYVTEDLPAWNPALRSKTAVRTSPTRHFCDPSIGAALLGASPRKLLLDFSTFGLFFESLCVRDLRVYAAKLRGTVYHYRDKTGLEADAVVVLDDGRWGAVEVKLGEKQVEEGAAHLLKLASRVDDSKEGAPSFLMVLTGQQAAYCRPDGVYVVPITCLAP